MKKIRRMTALLLCMMMAVPTQGMAALSETETVIEGGLNADSLTETTENQRIQETLPLETVEETVERIQETLTLEPVEGISGMAVYWNPGGRLPEVLTATPSDALSATPSDAQSTPSNIAKGSDRADGLTPERPVRTLEAALKQADRLAGEQGMDRSDIVIYAMNPMEIANGSMYVLNAGSVRIASWSDRTYKNDTIFYVNGGQLALMNVTLEPGDEGKDEENAELIRVDGGTLQFGQNVEMDGKTVMDYRSRKEQAEWNVATASDATPSNATPSNAEKGKTASASSWTEAGATGSGFDIDSYILNTEPDEWELLEDKGQAGTWKEPVIELMEGFNGGEGEILLEIREDGNRSAVVLAKTLYADSAGKEEFASFFRLTGEDTEEWDLIPESEKKATVRDTGASDLERYYRSINELSMEEDESGEEAEKAPKHETFVEMTVKVLTASRPYAAGTSIYWNPGAEFNVGGITYPEGNDRDYTGLVPSYPVKTLEKAMEKAAGGTIYVMQAVNLTDADAELFMPSQEGNAWIVKALNENAIPILKMWEVKQDPIFRVGVGETLILENITLEGPLRSSETVEGRAIQTMGGDMVIRSGVTAKTGSIELDATKDLVNHWIQADSTTDVSVTLSFTGINEDLKYLYTDVVKPTENLLAADADEAAKTEVGAALLGCYQISQENKTEAFGGSSRYDWTLRQDTEEDDQIVTAQNLELYAEFYYGAVYLNGVKGDDNATGAFCDTPVRTWARARRVWEAQMLRSIAARTSASNEGMSKEEINEKYPYPDTIYICETVTVSGTEQWNLGTMVDYDGAEIKTEVASHREIPNKEGTAVPVHDLPKYLVEVVSGGQLRVAGLTMRNDTNLPDSATIRVNGGYLSLAEEYCMTGAVKKGTIPTIVDATGGTHIQAVNGATVALYGNSGIVELRQQGITADGAGTLVIMNGGTIRNNKCTQFSSGDAEKNGGGVSLSGGASFKMDNGMITGNSTSQYGGGVYLTGTGTTFTMNAGSITENRVDADSVGGFTAYGLGIYGADGTVINIGTASSSVEATKVSGNVGGEDIYVKGGGICSSGSLTVKNAAICNNILDGNNAYASSGASYGAGIYAAGTLEMDGAIVSGNEFTRRDGTSRDGTGTGVGAGMCIISTQKNIIKNSTIQGNKIGYKYDGDSYYTKYSCGGGIYLEGKLDIENTSIAGNYALSGAGICAGNKSDNELSVMNCDITDNKASTSLPEGESELTREGEGVGVYLRDGSAILKDCQIEYNERDGIFVYRGSVKVMGSSQNKMQIRENKGAGIYFHLGSVLAGENILVEGNKNTGIVMSSMGGDLFLRKSTVRSNTGLYGGGIRGDGDLYLEDVKVDNNRAIKTEESHPLYAECGGGIFAGENLYWSETTKGGSSLNGNSAQKGGGLYIRTSGGYASQYVKLEGEIQNTASVQGSNVYGYNMKGGFLQGSLVQPENPADGVYNVYLSGDKGSTFYMDPQNVTIQSKTGGPRDAVYLDKSPSCLVIYSDVGTETLGVEMNKGNYVSGSVIVKPANKTSETFYKPNADLTGKTSGTVSFGAALQDASAFRDWIQFSQTSGRLQLAAGKDGGNSSLTNLILLGEGVYLSSQGTDANGGTTPEDAVATFAKAKEVLEKRITEKKAADDLLPEAERSGFAPYIYLCGPVQVTGTGETWRLNYEDALFVTDNAAFSQAEQRENPDIPEAELKAQVRRFASFVSQPMITVGDGISQTKLILDDIIIDGRNQYVDTAKQSNNSPIIYNRKDSSVKLCGDAQLCNNYKTGILSEGEVYLDGAETEVNQQIRNIDGAAIETKNNDSYVTMSGYSAIVKDEEGIASLSQSTDQKGIYGSGTGGGKLYVSMEGNSRIESLTTTYSGKFGVGISIGAGEVHMKDSSCIKNVSTAVSGGSNSILGMNANETGTGSAHIVDCGTGISTYGDNIAIVMGNQAKISSGNTGISMRATVRDGTGVSLTMKGDSSITGTSISGIAVSQYGKGPAAVNMQGNARISKSQYGIYGDMYSYSSSSSGADRVTITMDGNSQICSNKSAGIYLKGDFWNEDSYQKIVLKGSAIIGSDTTDYSADAEDSGNGGSGIRTYAPTDITVSGLAMIAHNSDSGISLERSTSQVKEPSAVTMTDFGIISDNRNYGIHNPLMKNIYGANNPTRITIKGASSITANSRDSEGNFGETSELFFNKDSELHMEGTPHITSGQGYTDAIKTDGKIFMGGNETITGRIHLTDSSVPITLESAPGVGNKFHLHLVEGFMGKPVVIPDGKGLADVSKYLSYFVRDLAEGEAKDKPLVAVAPNIILEGDNNVYLSGTGSDINDGLSPETAVRSFAKAKELLQTGYYTKGANILICDTVKLFDSRSKNSETWSFDENGMVTNQKSGESWTPMVQRYKNFTDVLIYMGALDDSMTLYLENIIIDGNKENGVVASDALVEASYGGVLVLGNGAVLQNNKVLSGNSIGGIKARGAMVEIDGGIIRGMEVAMTSSGSPSTSAIQMRGGGSDNPGVIKFISGQIYDNVIKCSEDAEYASGGAVYVISQARLIMSGGMIYDNRNDSRAIDPEQTGGEQGEAAGVYILNAKAEITGGVIRGNSGALGSAVYYEQTGKNGAYGLILSGGQIEGNTTNQYIDNDPIGEYAPVYVNGPNFQLKGGGCDIRDGIYLKGTESRIKVSGSIYQKNRNYKVYLDEGSAETQYQKGSVVVMPDGSGQTDVTPYQPYFSLYSDNYVLDYGHSDQPVEAGTTVREDRSLVLMKPVFLDGTGGDDSRDGTEPGQAVQTFTGAVETGQKGDGKQDYYVVYVCGETGNTEAESTWNMDAPAYLCRYTGFPLYKRDGNTRYGESAAYYGNLIVPRHDLNIGRLEVYGRRASDAATRIGESLFRIPAGVTVTVEGDGNAVFGRNRNIGQYTAGGASLPTSLSGKGGAFCVEPQGNLSMSSGRISEVDAVYGSAVYLGTADEAGEGGTSRGRIVLDNTPVIRGSVYLSGSGISTAAYVEAMISYAPEEPLQLSVGNDYDGRACVSYPEGTSPGTEKMAVYSFEESIKSLYEVGYRKGVDHVLELRQKAIFYLDGEEGSATNDGMTPNESVMAISSVFDHIKAMQDQGKFDSGAVVYVAGKVTLDGHASAISKNIMVGSFKNTDGSYTSFYKDISGKEIRVSGQISFKRYVRPTAYSNGGSDLKLYSRESYTGSLFELKNAATLSFLGITLDGHAQTVESSNQKIAAKGIDAQAPLITVDGGFNSSSGYTGGGTLVCGYASEGTGIPTRFQNNTNENQKNTSLGQWQGTDITEGSSAGIELLGGEMGGICHLSHTEFVNLSLGGAVAAGGTDVYHNGGEMSFSEDMLFSGSVFLEGLGTAAEPETSRFMTVDAYGVEARSSFQVLMRDSYKGRKVMSYPEGKGPADDDIALYRMEEQVTEKYGLLKRTDTPWILELKVPAAVYMDGGSGNDDADGATAAQPVQTLKRAYELLNSRAGNTIYVVGTVPVDQSVQISGDKYEGTDGTVLLRSTSRVYFVRYIQPDFAVAPVALSGSIRAAGFEVSDFTGALFEVRSGGMLSAKNITFNGHSQPQNDADDPQEVTVSRTSRSNAPILRVNEGAEAVLSEGTILRSNDNAFDGTVGTDAPEIGMYGGAVSNRGSVTADGAAFENNHSLKGDAAYQGGIFTIQSNLDGLADHSFYLASTAGGTVEHPVYDDAVLTIAQPIPDGQIFPIDMDMERAVPGRDVIRFSDSGAYAPEQGADAEYVHFALGSMVPQKLMLVEAADDSSVLELQDWKVLDVEVPSDIYLTMVRDQTTDNGGVAVGSVQEDMTGLFTTPEYRITNNGRYDVKVSVSGLKDMSADAGIVADAISLKETAAEAVGVSDLYLAVKGTDRFATAETALTDSSLIELGELAAGAWGSFEFTGAASDGFIDNYKDRDFPLTGDSAAVKSYMDGTSPDRTAHACAKYLLKYKVELAQPRR